MIQIKDFKNFDGKTVDTQGWVMNKRSGKGLEFIILRDGSGFAQCIVNADDVSEDIFNTANKLTQESSVKLSGKIVKDEKQIGGYELHVTDLELIGTSVDYPISNKEHGIEFLMDHRHLWLRSKRQWAILKIRNRLIYAINTFFQKEGFVQTDSPIFTPNAAEGSTTLFSSKYYDDDAYLAQTGQLYGEAMAMAMGKIYTFGPTFRAEKSKTRRHLSEFWMIEPEMAFHDNAMNMDVIESFLKYIINDVLENCKTELELLERDTTVFKNISSERFPRLTYDEAVDIIKGKKKINGKTSIEVLEADLKELKQQIEANKVEIEAKEKEIAGGVKKGKRNFLQNRIDILKNDIHKLEIKAGNIPKWIESAANFEYGNDFGGSDETVITIMFDVPVMVYNWPHKIKAFYMKRDAASPELAKGVDVLAPEGYGEIVGGGERETDLNLLLSKIEEHKLPMKEFEWYLDLRKYGSVPHAGFGLGLERTVAWVCGTQHIRETIPFPRYYGRLRP
ncbi:MAG: asparagine--tRNA ligase [Bacteroidetes bacterium]|nr:MAG: asparagine--tRNA ligase [Bacteroidota bacterium]